jgi:hypothetical protein
MGCVEQSEPVLANRLRKYYNNLEAVHKNSFLWTASTYFFTAQRSFAHVALGFARRSSPEDRIGSRAIWE